MVDSRNRYRILHFAPSDHYDVLHMSQRMCEPLVIKLYTDGRNELMEPEDVQYHLSDVEVSGNGQFFVTFNSQDFILFNNADRSGYHAQIDLDRPLFKRLSYQKCVDMLEQLLQEPDIRATCNACLGNGATYNGPCPDCYGTGVCGPQQQRSEFEMNTNEMITIMQMEGGAKIVSAVYLEGRKGPQNGSGYHFKNVVGMDLKTGDLIVCETRDTFSIMSVVDPDVMPTDISCPLHDLKHVVAKIRNDDYRSVKEAEANAHRQLALSEVTSKLDTYRKQVGDGTFIQVSGLLGITKADEVIDTEDN